MLTVDLAHPASPLPDRRERAVAKLLAQLIGLLEGRPLPPSHPGAVIRAPPGVHLRVAHLCWGISADASVVGRRRALGLEASRKRYSRAWGRVGKKRQESRRAEESVPADSCSVVGAIPMT